MIYFNMTTNKKLYDDSSRTDSRSTPNKFWVDICEDCDCGLKFLRDNKTPIQFTNIICKRTGHERK